MKRVALLLLLATATAHAQPSEAERLYTAGQKAYDDRRYDEAVAAWERSYSLSQLPALLFNIAQAYRLRALPGDCTKATETYQRFLALDRTSAQRAKAQGFIGELQPCVAAEGQSAPPPPAKPPATATVEERPIVEHGGGGKKLAAYVVGGLGVGLAVTGVYFGAKARSLGDEVSDACKDGCSFESIADKDAEGRSAARKQYVFYGLGGVGIVTAGVLYYLGSREHAPRVAVTPRANGAVVTWHASW